MEESGPQSSKRAPVRADDGSYARQNLSLLRVEFRLRDQALVQQGLELGELLFCGGAVLHIATNVVVQLGVPRVEDSPHVLVVRERLVVLLFARRRRVG